MYAKRLTREQEKSNVCLTDKTFEVNTKFFCVDVSISGKVPLAYMRSYQIKRKNLHRSLEARDLVGF